MDPRDPCSALSRANFERRSETVHYAWLVGENDLRARTRVHYTKQPRAWETRAWDGYFVDIDV